MNFQLVIQFSEELLDYDNLIELEDELISTLANKADVDGHDIGSGEVNFFILTDTPEKTFNDVRKLIEERLHKEQFSVAYRKIEEDEYTILWPSDLLEFEIK